jgi:hypothetical protein
MKLKERKKQNLVTFFRNNLKREINIETVVEEKTKLRDINNNRAI